ncbi:MAG: extracellular solute-binding protein [Devosia sp.]|nr:extracellular solute-binding protein [Devosia sp.]
MSFSLDRRQFLLGSTALVAAGAVSPAFAQDKRLRLTWWGGQARADRTNAVSDLYAKAHPGVAFDTEFNAFNDYWPKLGTQVAGGNAPDVLQMDYRYLVEYANRGAIAALDDYVGKGLKLDDFDQDQQDGGKVDGKLYAISLGANSVSFMINQKAFADAGVPEPTRDWSYEDYKANAAAFNAKSNGVRLLADGSGSEPGLENWLRQRGKALYKDGKIGWDADDLIAWFKMWVDLRAAQVCVSPEDQALDATAAIDTTMITLGKAATSFANSNQLIAFQAVNKDPLTMVNFPRAAAGTGGGHYRKPSQFWSVNPKSPLIEDAVSYVSFFVNDLGAGAALGVERGIPCSKAVRDAIAPTLDAQSQIALNFVSNLGDLQGKLPPVPPAHAGEVSQQLNTKAQEVAFGTTTPEDAGAAFAKEAADILARAS